MFNNFYPIVPPDINDEISSSEVLVKEGENAVLRCVASGTPAPIIAWRREDSRHFKMNNATSGKFDVVVRQFKFAVSYILYNL